VNRGDMIEFTVQRSHGRRSKTGFEAANAQVLDKDKVMERAAEDNHVELNPQSLLSELAGLQQLPQENIRNRASILANKMKGPSFEAFVVSCTPAEKEQLQASIQSNFAFFSQTHRADLIDRLEPMGFIFEDVDGGAPGPEDVEPDMEPPQEENYQEEYWEDVEEDHGTDDYNAGYKGRKGRLKFHSKGSFRDRFKRAQERKRDDSSSKGKHRGRRRTMEDKRSFGKGKQRTDANCIEVEWKPPNQTDDGTKEGAEPQKERSPVRGPAGRGRATTLPSWMTKSDNSQDEPAAPEPAPMVTGGRGRGLTLPSWMTKGVTEAAPPAIPDLADDGEGAGQAAEEAEPHALDSIFEERDKNSIGNWGRKRSRSRGRKGKGKGKDKRGKGKQRHADRHGGWGGSDWDEEDGDWTAEDGTVGTAADEDAEAAETAPWNKADSWNSARRGGSWKSGGDSWRKQASWGSGNNWSGSSWNKQDWNSQGWQGHSKQNWDRNSNKGGWRPSQDEWKEEENSGGDQEWATAPAQDQAAPGRPQQDATQQAHEADVHGVPLPPPPQAPQAPQAAAVVGKGSFGSNAATAAKGRGVRGLAPTFVSGDGKGRGVRGAGPPAAFASSAAAAAAHSRMVRPAVIPPKMTASSLLTSVRPGSPGSFVTSQVPTVPANSGVTVPPPMRAAAPRQNFAQDLSIPGLDGLFAGLAESGEAAEE